MPLVRANPSHCLVVVATAVTIVLPACGSASDSMDLSPAAAEGRATMRRKGCGSCHGSNGGGGIGPAFVDLLGSEAPLADGSSVTADRAYLVESITEPSAKIVDGYTLPMPKTNLSTDEIDAIITYIEALTPPGTTAG
ncbi:MAG: c-type cytochrome [Ilumatobacter sp.]